MSFEPIGRGLDRSELLKLAEALRRAGIGVQSVDGDSVLLVRSEDVRRATAVIDAAIDAVDGEGASDD